MTKKELQWLRSKLSIYTLPIQKDIKMKKFLIFCSIAIAVIMAACGGASANIDKAWSIVKEKGDTNKVYELITASPIDYESLSMEDMAKLGMSLQYVSVSSWGHINEQIKEQNKVLGEMSIELTNRKRSFTPEQQKEYQGIAMKLFQEVQ